MTSLVGRIDAVVYGACGGPIHCNDAAEVIAAGMAVRLSMGEITVCSDSSFFVDGWNKGRKWCTSSARVHADVWLDFWRIAEDYGVHLITVEKVKGHATEADICRGLSSPMDKYGNDQADAAAKRGAALHGDCPAKRAHQAEIRQQADKNDSVDWPRTQTGRSCWRSATTPHSWGEGLSPVEGKERRTSGGRERRPVAQGGARKSDAE